MAFGMSYEEYWDGDVKAHRMYREKYRLEMKRKNFEVWLQGRYFYDALCAVSPIIRAFSKAKKPGEYPQRPYDLTPEDREETLEREQRERYERMKEKVALFASEFNKKRHESPSEGE